MSPKSTRCNLAAAWGNKITQDQEILRSRLISIIGYKPDIFSGPIIGKLLDNNPDETGHRYVFWMLAGFSLIGGVASWIYHRLYGNEQDLEKQ